MKIEEALQAMAAMIERSEKAQDKFAPGTPQHTLQKNRVKALKVALSLMENALAESGAMLDFNKEDYEKALAPITSLIRKSEKAQKKLREGTWQRIMLSANVQALHIALSLLTEALGVAVPL